MKQRVIAITLALGFVVVAHAQSTDPSKWSLQEWDKKKVFSVHPTGLLSRNTQPFYFDFPTGTNPQTCCSTASAGVDYFTTPFSSDLTGATELVFTFQTQTTGNSIFGANLQPDNQYSNCYAPSGYPAIVTPILVRTGSWSDQFSRWWARDYRVAIQPNGTFQVVVPMEPAKWMSVFGVFGDQNLAAFQDALRNMAAVGVTFGGGCYLSHGVNVQSGTGTARFILVNYSLR